MTTNKQLLAARQELTRRLHEMGREAIETGKVKPPIGILCTDQHGNTVHELKMDVDPQGRSFIVDEHVPSGTVNLAWLKVQITGADAKKVERNLELPQN